MCVLRAPAAMAQATQQEFEARAWRVQGIPTEVKKYGSHKYELVMKYRTSATHAATKYATNPFRSHDRRYDKVWASKEEALRSENVQAFRDFVQRGFAHGGGSSPTIKRTHEDTEAGARREGRTLRGSARGSTRYVALAENAKAMLIKAAFTGMANFVKRQRKNLRFRHGAVKQPNRKA